MIPAVSRSAKVTVAGLSLSVRTDAKPKYLKDLASYVEQKIQTSQKGKRRGASSQHTAILAALAITDELFLLREEHKRLRRTVAESSQRVLQILDREATHWNQSQ